MSKKPDDPKPGQVAQKDSEFISPRKRLAMGGSPTVATGKGVTTK